MTVRMLKENIFAQPSMPIIKYEQKGKKRTSTTQSKVSKQNMHTLLDI